MTVWKPNSTMMGEATKLDLEVQRATIVQTTPKDEQFLLWLELVLELAATEHSRDEVSLVIRIVDEEEGQSINNQYRSKDYPTNVLSFPQELPDGLPAEINQGYLGDLLICAPVVVREAREQDKRQTEHWAHLSIHGALHLLGFDHELSEEAEEMEALEIKILSKLGIADPYEANMQHAKIEQ